MKITDQELLDAFHRLKVAAEADEALQVEKGRLESRLADLRIHFEDGGEEAKAKNHLRELMVQRNMKILLVGDDVAVLTPNRVVLATGITELKLENVA